MVRDESGDWFEPPLPVALAAAGPHRIRPPWRGAVRVAGASFDDLSDRFERDGAVEGSAALTGVWSAGLFQVEGQGRPGIPAAPGHALGDTALPAPRWGLAPSGVGPRCPEPEFRPR
ncbi:MAG TPA: hypothetical protein VKV33_10105 [Streptosporangiaceae bacterium]|nr:hypothetical protein [Streptosporangiaceae bacterium]